jgi:magnesium transporter
VLTVFLFDERESEQVEDWRAALKSLADDELLWLALRDPTEDEVTALQEALELGDENAQRLLESKESTFGSFDLLVARIGQRTNDIVKVLTLVTVVLLPATVLAGIMGMNFQVGLFDDVWLFWVVIVAMLSIAALVLSVARSRRWI